MKKLKELILVTLTGCGVAVTGVHSPALEAAERRNLPPNAKVELGDESPAEALKKLPENVNVRDVVNLYGALLGCRLVQDNSLAGPITVNLDSANSREEIVDVVERTLIANGYGLTDVGDGVLMVTGLGKNPRVYAQVYSGVEQLPQRERIVTCILPVKHREAMMCSQILSQFIVPSSTGFNQILADEKSRSLIVTDTTSGVRRISQLLAAMDVPGDPNRPVVEVPRPVRSEGPQQGEATRPTPLRE